MVDKTGISVEELSARYPRLYHMAEADTWESISTHGLMSTSALLDFFEIKGKERRTIEKEHRPQSVRINHPQYGTATIRDQKPMSDADLNKCLIDMTPSGWYQNLNKYVFFWLTRERLLRLLNARAYRSQKHCVLTIDTALMLSEYADKIKLTALNSGCTKPIPRPRGTATFLTLNQFPFQERRKKGGIKNAVAELAVEYAVPNVSKFVLKVEHILGDTILESIYEA